MSFQSLFFVIPNGFFKAAVLDVFLDVGVRAMYSPVVDAPCLNTTILKM